MSTLLAFLNSWAAVGAALGELLQYGGGFLKNLLLPKAVLAARVLAAESQLALCAERLKRQGVRPSCYPLFFVLWPSATPFAGFNRPAPGRVSQGFCKLSRTLRIARVLSGSFHFRENRLWDRRSGDVLQVQIGAISKINSGADSHGKKVVPFDSKSASQTSPQSNLQFSSNSLPLGTSTSGSVEI